VLPLEWKSAVRSKKILIVEDDKILAETLQAILTDTGWYEIALAYGGDTGLKLAEEFQPDLIILDLLMPGMTGMDLLAEWNKTGLSKRIPITVATNLDQLQIVNRALEMGARNYFLKSEMSPESIVKHCQSMLATTDKQASGD
jgi:DNA-binding response OmpR family regulator